MKLRDLTIEYRNNPIGLDVNPRFSWKIESRENNTLQTAYQVIVTKSLEEVWNTGKVETEESIFIPYQGQGLLPTEVYQVQVIVWDNYGNSAEGFGTFETGLLSEENWKAKWITHNLAKEETACPVFAHTFVGRSKKLLRARIYATALGVYEIQLNGTKAGDAFLAPGWTSYHNRLQYQTYDVTDLVSEGENKIQVTIGNGWYKGYLNGEGEKEFYGDQAALLGMLFLEYEDGEKIVVGTDGDWSVTTGAILSSELYLGETQDLTKEAEMVLPTASEKASLFLETSRIRQIVSQESEPVRITKRILAKEKIITPKGELVIDFGQNMAGLVEIKLPELTDSDRLVVHHAEALDKEGNFYNENYRSAISRDVYIYGKEDIDKVVMPHFTYHGFRYIKVEGISHQVDLDRFCACAMHTDMEHTGSFWCSNPLINQLQSNIEWGQRSNYFDIPTDCPQRDERLGWTGDAQIFAETGCFNFNSALFFKKWLHDVAAESDEQTGVPQIVPNIVGKTVGTSVWSDCATVIPWVVYQTYGDKQVLIDQYDNMKLWVEFIRKNCGNDVLWLKGFQRGDWLSLDSDASLNLMSGGTDKNLVANVYYAYSTRILRDTAKVLGKDEFKEYAVLYDAIVEALNEEYVTPKGRLVSETQTACALLLHFDLLKEEYRPRVIKLLEDNLMLHKGQLTTGFVGTAFICHALTESGKHELAEKILLSENYPGWLYAVKMGATTIWERWNSVLPNGDFDQSGMNSLNHYTFGSIGDWMYRKIAGINQLEAGYKKILIRPVLTHTMAEVKASFESVYGTISCTIKCAKKKAMIDITIPANTTAVIVLPEQENEIEVGSGNYHYECDTKMTFEVGKYSMNTTMGQLFEDEYAIPVIRDTVPGMKENPMMEFLKNKTLSELSAMSPGIGDCFEKAIKIINEYYLNE